MNDNVDHKYFFPLPEHQDILVESSWATFLCLSFPSVKGPTGLEGPIHTFCQAKAGQLRCRHHQSGNKFISHSLGVFEAAWAARILSCTGLALIPVLLSDHHPSMPQFPHLDSDAFETM